MRVLETSTLELPRFGWGVKPVRLDDGTFVPELHPVALTEEAKRRHRATGMKRGRPKGALATRRDDGCRDCFDWHAARIVKGGAAIGLDRGISIAMAAMDVGVSVRTVQRALKRMRAERTARAMNRTNAKLTQSPLLEAAPWEPLVHAVDTEEIRLLHRRYDEP